MPAPAEIKKLVENFARHQKDYASGSYNETQVRRDFIDPFLKALGWDVDNSEGASERFREVVHEDKVRIGTATKAPDYSCRLGGNRIFFIEAKKPGVDIKNDPAPAFQLRRYGWSAKLPISVLTDFEELVIYDTTRKPALSDKASKERVGYWTFEEYVDKWDEISGILSKEAVKTGAFDRFAQGKKKRVTEQVDDDFLKAIDAWRELLAKDLAKENAKITVEDLNRAVQQILDRIIFLRIAEDRRLEQFGRLQAIVNGAGVYDRLRELFSFADQRYNSGLFHFKEEKGRHESPDTLTPKLKVGDNALKEIITALYDDNPWAFDVIPADILGSIYERFLGKTIRLTEKHFVRIEEKPEVRKAGGVYYTPKYIVDYIVQETVGKLLEGKTPKDAAELKILDPACGSGSFLIGAYQHLLDWHLEQYAHAPERHRKQLTAVREGEWRLATSERKRILTNSIHGVDIDPQAVEVTKLSLLLKVLEGETGESIQTMLELSRERALPDLGDNVRCGNSLIGEDVFCTPAGMGLDWEAAHPFSYERAFPSVFPSPRGGFDVVLGNPPYDVLEKERGAASWPHDLLAEYLKITDRLSPAAGGKLNLFRFFLVAGRGLVRSGGRLGMIVPMALLGDISCGPTRRHLLGVLRDVRFECFPQKDNAMRRVFRDAKLSTSIVVGTSAQKGGAAFDVAVYPWNSFADQHSELTVAVKDLSLLDAAHTPIPLTDQENWDLFVRLYSGPAVRRLDEVSGVVVTRGEINQTNYKEYICSDPGQVRMVKGVEIGPHGQWRTISQGEREFFDERKYLKTGAVRPEVDVKRIATQRITGVDELRRVVAAIVDPRAYFADSTNSIRVEGDGSPSLQLLTAVLNASVTQWRFRLTSTNNNVGTNELAALPFPSHTRLKAAEALVRRIEALVASTETAVGKLDSVRDLGSPKGARARSLFAEIDSAVCDLLEISVGDRRLIGWRGDHGSSAPALT